MPNDIANTKKAKQRIEEARRSGATELVLKGLELTELPGEIEDLLGLQTLNLSSNYLTEQSDSFGRIGKLQQLKSLVLDHNQLTTLPVALEQLVKLEHLNLAFNELTSLPDWIEKFTKLKFLKLFSNKFEFLPERLRKLHQLQTLDFDGNPLKAIPQWLGDLTSLESLNLYRKQLGKAPEWLCNLKLLKSLDLSENGITEIPEWLGELTELQLLNLANNALLMLPRSIGGLKNLTSLDVGENKLEALPDSIGQLKQLQFLDAAQNKIQALPETVGSLTQLKWFNLSNNQITVLPDSLGQLSQLPWLNLADNNLSRLSESLGGLTELQSLNLANNQLIDIPVSFIDLKNFDKVVYYNNTIKANPLNPELITAYQQGLSAVKAYLRAKAAAQITLNEAKLIIVGEGEVGKTCLMDAFLDNPWREHDTTHGIEIKPIEVVDPISQKQITLNAWDFGGQRIYRPTHQLFFSAPAVYLVVWKPREGPQQGFVKEWIQLIKRREPSAKIIIVATHGGPQQRQPDIDRQELWDLFTQETIVDFFFVDSKPDEQGKRKGIEELKNAIARIAATLPEVGRSVPKSFVSARQALQEKGVPYLSLNEVLAICHAQDMDDEIARLFITISHRLGHLTHYENDPVLHDIVILRPDWLATAISFVLDDDQTRAAHGLVKFSRLSHLWDNETRPLENRYPIALHQVFLRLMERFDLSYRVADPTAKDDSNPLSLIGQLVPDIRSESVVTVWPPILSPGDNQHTQICHIVDAHNGQSANAEGLFYQLIVRLHKHSLGRVNYNDSVHWQRGLVLDNAYNGRAFLEHKGNDIHITVRAPYPERFLAMLTEEVKYLVESFWEGLRCDVTVPCLNSKPCVGLFEVAKLIENKRRGRPEQPCAVCNEWQSIDRLLLNAPDARPISPAQFVSNTHILDEVRSLRQLLSAHHVRDMDRFNQLEAKDKEILSKIDISYHGFMNALTDEAKDGPRLFSLFPLERSSLNPKEWIRSKFRLVLWCEHSRLPLPVLNGTDSEKGVYDIELDRDWFKKASPYLKLLTGTLSVVLPVASSAIKSALDDTTYKAIEEQLDLSKSIIDATIEEAMRMGEFLGGDDDPNDLEQGVAISAQNATLREFHALLKTKDPGFGGLVRVMNKRQEFLWVHEKFVGEY